MFILSRAFTFKKRLSIIIKLSGLGSRLIFQRLQPRLWLLIFFQSSSGYNSCFFSSCSGSKETKTPGSFRLRLPSPAFGSVNSTHSYNYPSSLIFVDNRQIILFGLVTSTSLTPFKCRAFKVHVCNSVMYQNILISLLMEW